MPATAITAATSPSAVKAAQTDAGAKPATKAADAAASFDQALDAAGDARAADVKAANAKAADPSTRSKLDDSGDSKDADGADKTGQDKTAAGGAGGGMVSWLVNLLGGQPAGTPQTNAKSVATDGKATPATAKAGKAGASPLTVPLLPGSGNAAEDDTADAAANTAPAVAMPQVHAGAVPTPALHTQPTALLATPDGSTQTPFAATLQFAQALDRAGGDTSAIQAQPTAAQPHTALPQDRDVWADTLNDQVRWQVGNDVREARLELHPRDLGTVQVQVRVTSEGTEVRFAADHAQAREALQQALPQLRSLLAGDGQLLSQAQVGSQSQSSRHFNMPFQSGGGNSGGDDSPGDSETVSLSQSRHIHVGLLDDFA
jgi:flagellar hook-length control protein FliK